EQLSRRITQPAAFKLVAAASAATFPGAIDPATVKEDFTGFTAKFTLPDPPSFGSYHAFMITQSGQTFLLKDALEIEEPDESDEVIVDERTGDLLFFPNQAKANSTHRAIAFSRRGKRARVTKQYLLDAQGNQLNWPIELLEQPGTGGELATLAGMHAH